MTKDLFKRFTLLVPERDFLSRLDWIEHKSWILLMMVFIMFSSAAFVLAVGVNSSFLRSQPAHLILGLATAIPVLTAFLFLFSAAKKLESLIIRFFAKLKSRRFIADMKKRLTNH